MMSLVSLLALGAGLAFQAPPTVQANSDGFRTPSNQVTPPNPALTPELRGDIMMARKMFREAIDFYMDNARIIRDGIELETSPDHGRRGDFIGVTR